jgi:PAS domain S-box-containing protein
MDTNTSISKKPSGAGGYFSVITDYAEEAIAVLDTNGVVRYANIAWVRMHGYEQRGDVVGRQINDFHNKEQMHDIVLPFLQEVGHRGRISGPVEHIYSDGKKVPTYTTMVALKDDAGRMRGIIVFAADTSELEQLKEKCRGIESELERRTLELKSAVEQQEKRTREVELVEELLVARGVELSSVNKQLWEYMSARAQTEEQVKALGTELAEKDKQLAQYKSQLQQQNAEQLLQDQYWKKQYSDLTKAIEQLRREVIEMKRHEVEFLDGIEEDAELVGAGGELAIDQIRELSTMAKKFVSE